LQHGVGSRPCTEQAFGMSEAALLKSWITAGKVLVLSKTYCPYCTNTKELLQSLKTKNLKIVELDTIGEGAKLQEAAKALTGQRTVPNVWIGSKHIGGDSDLQALHKSGKLIDLLTKEGCV
jgi:glutaredoxin 3